MSWTCYETNCLAKLMHPDKWDFCPYTGEPRKSASDPGRYDIPRSWHDNPAGWHKFKRQLDRLDADELRLSGLQRVKKEKNDGNAAKHHP